MKHLKRDKRGVSNVIVVMLSLILIVVIAANVLLWSYQMNQFDWERMEENVKILSVTRGDRSSWFPAENEYQVNKGKRLNGTYLDTQEADGASESFQEEDIQLETLRPSDVGQYAEWPGEYPSTSMHWSLVDEDPSDDDATYVENNAAAWKKESYNLQDPAGIGIINWIRVYIRSRVVAVGSSIITTLIRTYGTDYEDSNITLSTSYQNNYTQYSENPNTGSAWTWTELASLEAGASSRKLDSADVRLTAVWVLVNYSTTTYSLDMTNSFTVDLSTYALEYIDGIEMQLKYRGSDSSEKWYLKAYNWTEASYGDSGFNNTLGHTPTTSWDVYTVNLTDKWRSYINDDGIMHVELHEEQADADQTTIEIDFFAIRAAIDGTIFTFQNRGPLTSHIVSLWINNSTQHQRYDVNKFINSGDTISYVRSDINMPNKPYTVKIITERGNIAVSTGQ